MDFIDHDNAVGDGTEPPPEGWANTPDEMRRLARDKYRAGDYDAALVLLLNLYDTGARYPLNNNIAFCYARMGDLPNAIRWMRDALDDPQGLPAYDASDRTRGGMLEAYFQWSKGVQFLA